MTAPSSAENQLSQSLDTLYGQDDAALGHKIGIGSVDLGFDHDGMYQGVATHQEGDSWDAAAGKKAVVVTGGVRESDGLTINKQAFDDAGHAIVKTLPSTGNLTDRSGTIAAGGTDQTLAAALAGRKYLLIQNLHATEDLWINFGSAAAIATAGSILLAPGGGLTMEGAYVSPQAIHVNATTTGHKFTAKEA